jgi:hypothetical protein
VRRECGARAVVYAYRLRFARGGVWEGALCRRCATPRRLELLVRNTRELCRAQRQAASVSR